MSIIKIGIDFTYGADYPRRELHTTEYTRPGLLSEPCSTSSVMTDIHSRRSDYERSQPWNRVSGKRDFAQPLMLGRRLDEDNDWEVLTQSSTAGYTSLPPTGLSGD